MSQTNGCRTKNIATQAEEFRHSAQAGTGSGLLHGVSVRAAHGAAPGRTDRLPLSRGPSS